jgi:hypothetical protein
MGSDPKQAREKATMSTMFEHREMVIGFESNF